MMSRLSAIIVFLAITGCGTSSANLLRFEYTEMIMGVEARLVLYAPDDDSARRAARAAFDRLNELDGVMSDWREDSELMEVSRSAGRGPVRVTEDLFQVLSYSLVVSERSGGAFDVTIGPLTRLWRRTRQSGALPDEQTLAKARARVGHHLIALDPTRRTVALARPGMQLDLGGIGKGYAVDQASEALREAGLARHLVELGGDIRAGAPPPGKKGWRVMVTSARGSDESLIVVADAGVATSGDLEQHAEVGGTRYSHIVDPRTGLGLTARRLVTVIASDAATADALASAISVLGVEAGLSLLAAFPGTEALIEEWTQEGIERSFSDRFACKEVHL